MTECTGRGSRATPRAALLWEKVSFKVQAFPHLSTYESSGGDNSVAVCVLLLTQIDTTQVTGVLLNALFSDETFQKADVLVFVFSRLFTHVNTCEVGVQVRVRYTCVLQPRGRMDSLVCRVPQNIKNVYKDLSAP